MKPLSVLMIDGEHPVALAVAHCLHAVPRRRVRLHVLADSRRVPLRYSRQVASFRTWRGAESPDALEELTAIVERVHPDVGLAVGEAAIRFVAREAERLPVRFQPVPSLAAFDVAADKGAMAAFLAEHHLPHPATTLCEPGRLAEQRIRALPFPVLLKPRRGSNGIGIRRFDDPDSLFRHLAEHLSLANSHIVQTVVPGRDIDCSVLCEEGRIIACSVQRAVVKGPEGFRPPGWIEFVDDARARGVVTELMAALRWTGLAHVDLLEDERFDKVTVIEANPRFWGSILGSLHAGVNFPYLACQAGLGEPFAEARFHQCRYVSGRAAVAAWKRGHFGRRRAGFRFSETVFRHVLRDPGPTVAERLLTTFSSSSAA